MFDYNRSKSEVESEIESLNFDNDYKLLLSKIYPHSLLEVGEVSGRSGESLWDAIEPYQLVNGSKVYDTKISWVDLQSEIAGYKTEELGRIDRVYRGLSLVDWNGSSRGIEGYDGYSNKHFFLEALYNDFNDFKLQQIESADQVTREEYIFQQGVAEKKSRMDLGQRCIAAVNYMNDMNSVTNLQVQIQLSSAELQQIMQALNTGSLETAKALVLALDTTGLEPIDQTYKDRIIAMIDSYLGA